MLNRNNLNQSAERNYIHILLILLYVIAVYIPVSTLGVCLPWDVLDCYLPWRYHVSECIRAGEMPLWNPYQHLGYPIHADMRSVWSPGIWLISLIAGYNAATFNIVFVLMLFLSGLSLYLFLELFSIGSLSRTIAAIAYVSGGFFVSHMQEPSAIAAAACIPALLLSFIRLLQQARLKYALRLSLMTIITLTSCYQALSIISFYLMLVILIGYLAKNLLRSEYRKTAITSAWLALSGIITVVCCTVLIVTYIQVSDHVTRLSGLDASTTSFFPFTLKAAISFLTPYAVTANADVFNTDLTMANVFTGVFIMLAAMAGISLRKTPNYKIMWLMMAFGGFSFIASLGNEFVAFKLLFNYLPLFNLFRFPSFFLLFTALAALIPAAIFLDKLIDSRLSAAVVKRFKWLIILSIATFILLLIASLTKTNFSELRFSSIQHDGNLYHRILIHAVIQLALLSIALFFWFRQKKSMIMWLLLIEMAVSVRLNIPHTGYIKVSPQEINAMLKYRYNYRSFESENPLFLNTDKSVTLPGLWRNTNIFRKTVSAEGFNSFRLDGFEKLSTQHRETMEKIKQKPLVYFDDYSENPDITPDTLSETILHSLTKKEGSGYTNLRILQISAHQIKTTYFAPRDTVIHFSQNYYPGWEARIDGNPLEIHTANVSLMSVNVPAGNHELIFIYANNTIKQAARISGALFLLLLIALIIIELSALRTQRSERKLQLLMPIATVLVLFILALRVSSIAGNQKPLNPLHSEAMQYSSTDTLAFWLRHPVIGMAEIVQPQQYSKSSFKIHPDQFGAKRRKVVRVSGSFTGTYNQELLLVVHHTDAKSGEARNYNAIPLISSQKKPFEPNPFRLDIPLFSSHPKTDIITVYLWNNGLTSDTIGNLSIEILPYR